MTSRLCDRMMCHNIDSATGQWVGGAYSVKRVVMGTRCRDSIDI